MFRNPTPLVLHRFCQVNQLDVDLQKMVLGSSLMFLKIGGEHMTHCVISIHQIPGKDWKSVVAQFSYFGKNWPITLSLGFRGVNNIDVRRHVF